MSKDPTDRDFPTFLARAIAKAGFETPAAFARASGVSPSNLSRMLAGKLTPTVPTIETMAPVLKVEPRDLLALVYPTAFEGADLPNLPAVHPLAAEIGRMLADDSPLPLEDREILSTMVERLIDPYRRTMRKRRSA